MLEVTVRCRIDEDTKNKVNVVLDRMGMTLSTAIRLFLKRIAEEGVFPFELNRASASHDDLGGIKAALIQMINSGQINGQGFGALLGDELNLSADHFSNDREKGLPGLANLKAKKVRKP